MTGRRPARFWAVLGGIVILACALRFPGLFEEGTGYINPDERRFAPVSVKYGGGDLNPHWFYGPPLPSYLMFVGQILRFLAERITGEVADALDFKAQYLIDPTRAFVTARVVVLCVSLASIVHVALLANEIESRLPGRARTDWTGWVAALGLAISPMHVERSAVAMPDTMVALAFTVTAQFAFRLAVNPSIRAALVAGACSGVAAGTKYNGALSCLFVGAACFLAPGLGLRRRVTLALVGAGAFFGAFLLVCPWAVLDFDVWWHSTSIQLFGSTYRSSSGPWWYYLDVIWSEGFGAVWTLVVVAGLVAAIRSLQPLSAPASRAVLAMLVGILATAAYISYRIDLAQPRQILPVVPALIALGAAGLGGIAGALGRAVRMVVPATGVILAVAALPAARERYDVYRSPTTNALASEWVRGHVPGGAYVLCDIYHPWLVSWDDRERMRAGLPAGTVARMTPAYRWTTAFVHMDGPLVPLRWGGASPDDWDALRRLGDVYMIVSPRVEATYRNRAAAPGLDWVRRVRSELPLVHTIGSDGARGSAFEIYRLQ